MVEVLKSTFEEQLPLIEDAIRQADFIALDAEFTGLSADDQSRSSLFDSSEERYKKLRKGVRQFTITQIGISAFTKVKDENKYIAKTFNCYLYPPSFGVVDERFLVQASSFDFMTKYNFDFNKFVYEGISHLNEEQEQKVQKHLEDRIMFKDQDRSGDIDEDVMQQVCSRIAEWLATSAEGDVLEIPKENELKFIKNYILHTEIKERFSSVWIIYDKSKNVIKIQKSTSEEVEKKNEEYRQSRAEKEEKFFESLIGFTKVFRVLVDAQMPILGHNMLLDLLLIYDKFHRPLPETFAEFKIELMKIFPKIYDTKQISNTLRAQYRDEYGGLLDKTSLSQLYQSLESAYGQQFVIYTPGVVHANDFTRYTETHCPHEAGYDAYMCGYVFIRLAHLLTFQNTLSSDVRPCSFGRYVQALKPYLNKVNIIRGQQGHVNLDGEDPPSQRPELLFVQSRNRHYMLDTGQLAKWFSPHGSVDIRLQSKQRALVATGNRFCSTGILKAFRTHKQISVTRYNLWKHSPVIRRLLIAGTLLSGGLCVWAVYTNSKQR